MYPKGKKSRRPEPTTLPPRIHRRDQLLSVLLEKYRYCMDDIALLTRVFQRFPSTSIVEMLLTVKLLSEKELAYTIAQYWKYEFVRLKHVRISPQTLNFLEPEMAWCYHVVPLRKYGNTLEIATWDPTEPFVPDILAATHRVESVKTRVTTKGDIEHFLHRHYPSGRHRGETMRRKLITM